MDRRIIDVVFSSFLIIASMVILTNNQLVEGGVETELGSMVLPRVVAVAIMLFSAMIGIPSLINLLKKAAPGPLDHVNVNGFMGIAIYVAILAAYWYGMPRIGFLFATPVAMFAIAVLLGGRNWLVMTAVSVVVPTLVYFGCNHFLRVFLPAWTLS